ncbi:MAG: hypothetical protein COV44_11745 [Deltaproteobacteria bacterium CG11_big_fil_rev_8_21_14_0_20_45_16]|nr:MAG: hypothetical protein COV44_11745 [Deltaproteobacteria bacterium CG11_big_fil_rev_8_21_14_0_20_45_16]
MLELKGKLQGKVLIVEDDETTGPWLVKRLAKTGLDAVLANNKEDALKEFESNIFHAVVTDVYLDRDQNKHAGLDIIKAIGPTGTPLVIMTSAADLEIAREGINFGAAYLLEKPFEVEKLIEVLEKLWTEPRGLGAILDRFLDLNSLTNKEKEIVRLMMKGLSNREIANVSKNTEKTIKYHFTTIFEKCGVGSRTELFNSVFPT